ncbi:orotate phosphoribosyltransferase-like enzyme [Thermoplasmatales archaeon SCGC AB-539-N05]|nr:orotate phosphoribosyltransferase-like enzyme [Thermoplasmatales archaeon SCGC AB-539-N05]
MKEIEILRGKALRFKESGLTECEIAEELNVSEETALWLLSKGKEKKPEKDVKIGWRSIGVCPSRIGFVADALCDIILEESEKGEFDIDTVIGVAINGIPYATFVADKLDLELAILRISQRKLGAFCSNYASVNKKNVAIVDDVVGTGDTFRAAIKATKAENGKPVLCTSIINKRSANLIDGVPLRSLIRARVI